VIREILVDDHLDRFTNGGGIYSIELETARAGVVELDHSHGLDVSLHQRSRGDHLADKERSALLAAQAAERDIGDAGHRCENHRWIDGVSPQGQLSGHISEDRTSERRPSARPRSADSGFGEVAPDVVGFEVAVPA
jgi:hypothetical protein